MSLVSVIDHHLAPFPKDAGVKVYLNEKNKQLFLSIRSTLRNDKRVYSGDIPLNFTKHLYGNWEVTDLHEKSEYEIKASAIEHIFAPDNEFSIEGGVLNYFTGREQVPLFEAKNEKNARILGPKKTILICSRLVELITLMDKESTAFVSKAYGAQETVNKLVKVQEVGNFAYNAERFRRYLEEVSKDDRFREAL